jgi:Protein of unknown function (DUF2630)
MADDDIYLRIKDLVDEEHALNRSTGEDHADRRRRVEEQLDQCWDLLRQRQARRTVGEDPDATRVRPVGEVEGYLQ